MPDNNTPSPMNEEERHVQETSLDKIMELTRSLGEQIQQEVTDLADDDYAEVSLPSDSHFKSKIKTFQAFLAGGLIGAVSVLSLTSYFDSSSDEHLAQIIQERAAEGQTLTPIADISIPLGTEAQEETIETVHEIAPEFMETYTVKPKENLASVLKKAGLTNQESYKISTALADILDLKKIQVGDKVEVGHATGEEEEKILVLVSVEDRRGYKYTALRNEQDFFEANLIQPKVDLKMELAEGTIDGPFIASGKNSGIPTNVIQQIIWAFDGPIDFQRDLRKGDSFTAVFNKEYNMEGKPTGNGELLYASFQLRNKTHERFLYKDSKDQFDYYDEAGKIARKLFTRHPLNRPRQTSSFGMRRHPILGYSTMHWGTDYGAPIGTPIYAPGEGTIVKAGRKGAYGNYVEIRHNSEYTTAYAHMNEIHSKIKIGRKIKAGEVIGYVGNTGRSTGPHLHWELHKSGRKINPKTQKITAQKKLAGTELIRFYAERDKMRAEFVEDNTAIARAEAMPEDRKLAYQGPQKTKKTVKAKKARPQKTASRKSTQKKG